MVFWIIEKLKACGQDNKSRKTAVKVKNKWKKHESNLLYLLQPAKARENKGNPHFSQKSDNMKDKHPEKKTGS